MFSTLNLFRTLECPDLDVCKRINCPYSHSPVKPAALPADGLAALGIASRISNGNNGNIQGIKRPASPLIDGAPPPKVARIESPAKSIPSTPRPLAYPSTSSSTPNLSLYSRPPAIKATPAGSKIPLITRQAIISQLWAAFKELYRVFHSSHPEKAWNDALQAEEEVYAKTNKVTYKNACISAIAGIKRRPVPDGMNHPSVGTDSVLLQRSLEPKVAPITNFSLADLEPLLLSSSQLETYGFLLAVPNEEGGINPSSQGQAVSCDRCNQEVILRADPSSKDCLYHWGRPIKSMGGETRKMWSCCSALYPTGDGCQTGPHVFYEKELLQLHARHAFTASCAVERDSQLEVAALDCEGIYTTGGMSIARVSVCDGEGKEVFDELIKPDSGMEIIDYNTRFSGIQSLEKAVLDLSGVRLALDALIGPKTILIGHDLANDLKMLRMVHGRIVDTVVLFPSPHGLPYKRALRTLAKEYLSRSIQQGSPEEGHSSAEDALAALDLVKYYIKDKKERERFQVKIGR